ncbi:MAG: pyridoxamine 5'-phosphate oxidase family protein [Hyphomicrobium sp.]|jgi:general stress protein 26
MAENATPHDARAKVWDLIGRFQAAMLVTKSQNGALSGRPMSHIVKADEGLVYILTEQTTESAHAIEADPAALLTLADNKRYVSLSVRGSVSTDRALIERLWNPGAQAFWPNGPSDPAVCALILRPDAGEYWDGDNALSSGVKMIMANLTGSPPDLGDHGDVRM